MKKTRYDVIYLNDNEKSFYCNTFTQAIILAMAYAYENGTDMRVKYVSCEDGTCVKNIDYPSFEYCK
jgi:hypothetical protein